MGAVVSTSRSTHKAKDARYDASRSASHATAAASADTLPPTAAAETIAPPPAALTTSFGDSFDESVSTHSVPAPATVNSRFRHSAPVETTATDVGAKPMRPRSMRTPSRMSAPSEDAADSDDARTDYSGRASTVSRASTISFFRNRGKSTRSTRTVTPGRNPGDGGPDEAGNQRTVKTLRMSNQDVEFDEENQLGQTTYEIRAHEQFFSVPEHKRGSMFQHMRDEDNARRESRAARKSARRDSKAQRRESRAARKSKNSDSALPPQPGTISYSIEDAKRLGVLNLSKMGLGEIPETVFDAMPGTTRVINLSFNRLTTIDKRFTEYVLVQRLIANENLLESLPGFMSKMTDLRKLDLARNKLTHLPDSFDDMHRLEHVDLSGNQLSSLPDSFASLKLVTLKLCDNEFASAPRALDDMNTLEELRFDRNRLVAVPPTWASFKYLNVLTLDHNSIRDFPDEMLAECTHMHKISIRANPLDMATLQAKPSWNDFYTRRMGHFKRLLDAGTVTLDQLSITDR